MGQTWVIDAAAMVDLLAESPRTVAVADVALSGQCRLAAPQLLDLEVMHSLSRLARREPKHAATIDTRFEHYCSLVVERHDHDSLARRVWQLRHNFTAYDAAYVALAEALDTPLLTTDRRLARACEGVVATVPLQTSAE